MQNWFEKLVGFKEETPDQVRFNLEVFGGKIRSLVNGKVYQYGALEVVSLAELRNRTRQMKGQQQGQISIQEIFGDVQIHHVSPDNRGALFQAASQFNLLEMVHPGVTPEQGVGRYEYDRTQGPACAIACGAGTIYRNYFLPVNGKIGQTANNQIDCLEDMGSYFENENRQLWEMRNGYALATEGGLDLISKTINQFNPEQYEALKGKLKIGIQKDTEVTLMNNGHPVTQVYCSALPVAYSPIAANKWEAFARLILEATYEATLHAAILNRQETRNKAVFLTLVGGGAFGNRDTWLVDSISKVIAQFKTEDLNLKFVSYSQPSLVVRAVRDRVI